VNEMMKIASNGKVTMIYRPPVNRCCIGVVLQTGFDTSKGKLIRRVVAHAENPSIEQKDGLWIILFLLICSLFTSAYVLDQGMDN
jgi:cation-transporting ATPase 13A1